VTGKGDGIDPTVVPLVVVDKHGRRRVGPGLDDADVIDLPPTEPGIDELADLAMAAAVAMGSQAVRIAALPWRLTGAALGRASQGTLGKAVVRGLQAMLDDTAQDGRREMALATQRVEERLAKVFGVVVPVVVESLDVDLVLDQIDLNDLMERVDLDQLLAQIDVPALLERIDVNALLEQVEVDKLLDRIDVNALLDRVDLDAVMERADANAILERVDVDALMERIDIDALMERTRIEEIVARSTSQVADSTIDLGRRQTVGLDAVVMRLVDRVMGRDPERMPTGPPALVAPDVVPPAPVEQAPVEQAAAGQVAAEEAPAHRVAVERVPVEQDAEDGT
jgi:hypothetical protein